MESSPTNPNDFSDTSTGIEAAPPEAIPEPAPLLARVATLQERFAAWLLDTFISIYLMAGLVVLLKYFVNNERVQSFLVIQRNELMLIGSSAATFYFLYYFIWESVFLATPGKLLQGLSVEKRLGGSPAIISVLIRNLFRLVDYPLFFLTGVGLMEATAQHQRMGDILANTAVYRHLKPHTPLTQPRYGGVTRRLFAFSLDAGLILSLAFGLLLLIPVSRPLVALAGLNLVPALVILYLAISESLFRTTFGKAIFGMIILQEDGQSARFASLFVRNLFRAIDLNPLGYLCTALSSRKQRPGEMIAGTIVVRERQGVRGWLAVPVMLAIAVGVVFVGLKNPDSFLKQGMSLHIGPYEVPAIPKSFEI